MFPRRSGRDRLETGRQLPRSQQAYDEQKDLQFFRDAADSWVTIAAGSFGIFYPEDAHAPVATDGGRTRWSSRSRLTGLRLAVMRQHRNPGFIMHDLADGKRSARLAFQPCGFSKTTCAGGAPRRNFPDRRKVRIDFALEEPQGRGGSCATKFQAAFHRFCAVSVPYVKAKIPQYAVSARPPKREGWW